VLYKIKVSRALHRINGEIVMYGTSNSLVDLSNNFKQNLEQLVWTKEHRLEDFRSILDKHELSIPWYVINPHGKYSRGWNSIMSVLLLYTAILMPVRVAFYETVFFDAWTVLELCVDALFLFDIGVNCLTSYENKHGIMQTSVKGILSRYLKTWFVVDIVACIPFSLIEYGHTSDEYSGHQGNYNQLVRLARLPRLYKLLRVFRIVKAMKNYQKSKFMERLQDCLQVNSSEV
jgi:hypothetical protein